MILDDQNDAFVRDPYVHENRKSWIILFSYFVFSHCRILKKLSCLAFSINIIDVRLQLTVTLRYFICNNFVEILQNYPKPPHFSVKISYFLIF